MTDLDIVNGEWANTVAAIMLALGKTEIVLTDADLSKPTAQGLALRILPEGDGCAVTVLPIPEHLLQDMASEPHRTLQ